MMIERRQRPLERMPSLSESTLHRCFMFLLITLKTTSAQNGSSHKDSHPPVYVGEIMFYSVACGSNIQSRSPHNETCSRFSPMSRLALRFE